MPFEFQFATPAAFLKALRDWYAGEVLRQLLRDPTFQPTSMDAVGVTAYQYADSLIAARDQS